MDLTFMVVEAPRTWLLVQPGVLTVVRLSRLEREAPAWKAGVLPLTPQSLGGDIRYRTVVQR